MISQATRKGWPNLSVLDLRPTTSALHLWSQVVGKIRLGLTPWLNHSWHATFYLSARGFATGLMHAGDRTFELEFDLLGDLLRVAAADAKRSTSAAKRRRVLSRDHAGARRARP